MIYVPIFVAVVVPLFGTSSIILLLDDFGYKEENDIIDINLSCLIMRNSGSVQMINTISLVLGTIFRYKVYSYVSDITDNYLIINSL